MIQINEVTSLNANMTVKDASGNDQVVANLRVNSLDPNSMNLTIDVQVYNKTLLTQTGAVNIAGETPSQQYADFEAAVKAKAQSLGYVIFGTVQ